MNFNLEFKMFVYMYSCEYLVIHTSMTIAQCQLTYLVDVIVTSRFFNISFTDTSLYCGFRFITISNFSGHLWSTGVSLYMARVLQKTNTQTSIWREQTKLAVETKHAFWMILLYCRAFVGIVGSEVQLKAVIVIGTQLNKIIFAMQWMVRRCYWLTIGASWFPLCVSCIVLTFIERSR